MGQLTQTTAQIQVILDDADDANVGKTSLTDGSDTTAVAFKKSGFYSLQGSSSNAPSTDRAVLISAVRDTAATGEIRYGQIAITESNGLWWNRDDGGSLGTWYEAVTTASAQTLTNKTLTSPVLTTPQINDSAADHQYIFAGSNLVADRTVTLPLLTGNDTFVFEAHTQTLTNKTLTTPTVSGLTLSDASIIFEGATANDYETTLTVTDPTADRTITLPDATDTLVGLATTDTLTNKTLTSPVLNTGVSGTAVLDADDFTGASATTLATSESIKAYVDSQVGSFDQLSEVLAAGNTTGSNDIEVTDAQKVQFRDAAIYINSSADGQLDLVADTEIQIAATTVDINGNLDVSGTTVSAGKITADAGIDIDNINIDGTTIALSSGDLTIDAAGNIRLDADDNGEIRYLDGGTQYAAIKKDGNNALFQSIVADGDFIIQGIDGASFVSALTLDMSAAGAATFNSTITGGAGQFTGVTGTSILKAIGADSNGQADIEILSTGTTGSSRLFFSDTAAQSGSITYSHNTNLMTASSAGGITLDAAGDIILDAAGDDIIFKTGGVEFGSIFYTNSNLYLNSAVSNGDMIFRGNDGGSAINALVLDMSNAGAATFNAGATFGGDVTQTTGDYIYSGGGNFDIKHNTASQNIVFSTTPSGGSTAEVLRITSNGALAKLTGDLTLDVAGDIILDADGGDLEFKDGSAGILHSWKQGVYRIHEQAAGTQYNNSLHNHTNNYQYILGGSNGLILADNTDQSNRIIVDNGLQIAFDINGVSTAKFTQYGGLAFGSNNSAATTLDDYEEGTWTPVVHGSTDGAYTYSGVTSRYTKIGNLVTLTCQLTNITTSGSGHAGYLQIRNAPFNKIADTFPVGSVELSSVDMSSGTTFATAQFITTSSTNTLYIRQHGDNSGGGDLPVTAINSGTSDITISIQYIA